MVLPCRAATNFRSGGIDVFDGAYNLARVGATVAIWIGNFGDGMINTFDAMDNSTGQPTDKKGKALNVDGLWTLVFGNGSNKAATTSLYFTAGPNMESEGIFGKFDVTK
jgi:hypothetical protein